MPNYHWSRYPRLTLVEWDLVPTLVHSCEAEVAKLSYSPVLCPIHEERCIVGSSKLLCMLVLNGQTYSLATKPVPNIICISVYTWSTG